MKKRYFVKRDHESESDRMRELLCEMIEQAVLDAQNETEYKSHHKRAEMDQARVSAVHFIRSDFFVELCNALKLPSTALRIEALKLNYINERDT